MDKTIEEIAMDISENRTSFHLLDEKTKEEFIERYIDKEALAFLSDMFDAKEEE